MAVATTIPSYQHHYQKLNHRISASLYSTIKRSIMATTTTNNGGEYTAIKETVTFEREIKKSKFIAIAGRVHDEHSAFAFLCQVRDPKATHNGWAYKVGDQYRSNDDDEPSGTAGKPIHSAIVSSGIDRVMVVVIRYFGVVKPIHSAIVSSGIDRVMVVVIRYFGGIKLGTGGLVRAYGGVASECLRNAPTCLIKSKVPIGVEVPDDQLGVLNHQLQAFQAEDNKQDYETGKDGITMVFLKVDFDKADQLGVLAKDLMAMVAKWSSVRLVELKVSAAAVLKAMVAMWSWAGLVELAVLAMELTAVVGIWS